MTDNGHFAVSIAAGNTLADGDIIEDVLSADTLLASDNLVATEDVLLWDFVAFDDEMHNVDLRVIKTIDVTESVMDNGPVWALPVAAAQMVPLLAALVAVTAAGNSICGCGCSVVSRNRTTATRPRAGRWTTTVS